MRVVGVDFTSAPKRDKPIVVADCEAEGATLLLKRFLEFTDWPAYELWLEADDEWIGGFDFPFGLPRRFVEAQRWPSDWSETDSRKIALEAYPGYVVRRLRERYYKNDKQNVGSANSDARKRIVQELLTASTGTLSCSLSLGSSALRAPLLHASGDWLDAVLCATQAHWAWLKRDANFGLPRDIDSREGWLISAPL